eukprot:COSAG01_NODE_1419_length_10368_cov_131.656344_9_plen_34_part_00
MDAWARRRCQTLLSVDDTYRLRGRLITIRTTVD